LAVLYDQLGFRGTTEYLKIAIVKIKKVWRGINGAQGPVHVKFVPFKFLGKPSGKDQLKNIAPKTVFFGQFYMLFIFAVLQIGDRPSGLGKIVSGKIFNVKELFDLGNIIFGTVTVGKDIGLVLKMVNGHNIAVYGIMDVRNGNTVVFFGNPYILKITYRIVGYISEQTVVDKFEIVIMGFESLAEKV